MEVLVVVAGIGGDDKDHQIDGQTVKGAVLDGTGRTGQQDGDLFDLAGFGVREADAAADAGVAEGFAFRHFPGQGFRISDVVHFREGLDDLGQKGVFFLLLNVKKNVFGS